MTPNLSPYPLDYGISLGILTTQTTVPTRIAAAYRNSSTENFFISNYMKSQSPSDNNNSEQTLDKYDEEIHRSLVFPQSSHAAPIPEFDSLVDLILRLQAIVYPGFRSNESSSEKVLAGLRSQIDETHQLISRQIAIAIARHFEACEDMTLQDLSLIHISEPTRPY